MPRKLMLIVMLTLVAAALSNPNPTLAQDGEKAKPTPEQRKAEREARDKAFAEQLANAKITLTEAIAKAESATGGKAIMAAYKPGKKGALTVHVMILTDAGRKAIRVDAQTGEVAQPGNKPKREKNADGAKPNKKDKKKNKDKNDDEDDDNGGEDEM